MIDRAIELTSLRLAAWVLAFDERSRGLVTTVAPAIVRRSEVRIVERARQILASRASVRTEPRLA